MQKHVQVSIVVQSEDQSKVRFGSSGELYKTNFYAKLRTWFPEVTVVFRKQKMYMVVEIMCCESM